MNLWTMDFSPRILVREKGGLKRRYLNFGCCCFMERDCVLKEYMQNVKRHTKECDAPLYAFYEPMFDCPLIFLFSEFYSSMCRYNRLNGSIRIEI